MAVVIIVGILSSIAIISANGVRARVSDASVLSDIDAMDAAQANYAVTNNVIGLAYYSGTDGYSSVLDFEPSEGNVIDVVINHTDYCIRGYNPAGTKNSNTVYYQRESSPGACIVIQASIGFRS